MTDRRDAVDACPFPPDAPPPPKTLPTNLLEQVDRFFESWRNYLVLVTVMGLVLAYSLLVVPPSLITRGVTPDTWNTQLEPKQYTPDLFKGVKVGEPDYTILDQIVLEGNQVLEFKNQVVRFSDLVLVKDNVKIILRNSTLIAPDYPGHHHWNIFSEGAVMLFNGSARLEAYDSIIVPSSQYIDIRFIGSSSCHLVNTVVVNCTLRFDDSSTLEAVTSLIYGVDVDRSSSLKISGSYVGKLKHEGHLRNPVKEVDASAYIEDSQVDLLLVRVVNSSICNIAGQIGGQSLWNIYDAFKVDGATMNVTMRNSTAALMWVYAINSELSITDTDIYTLQASFSKVYLEGSKTTYLALYGNSSLQVKDSNIYAFATRESSLYETYLWDIPMRKYRQEASITGTRIEQLNLGANCELNFSDVYVGEAVLRGFESTMRGGITWGQNISYEFGISPYRRFTFIQFFEVHTYGSERVFPEVKLVLTDKDGNVVWEDVSDGNGEASFNLTFCQYYPLQEPYQYVTNYMDEWTLKAVYEDEAMKASVALFKTGSPIVFEFSEDKQVLPVSNATLTYFSVAVIILITALKLWRR